MYEPFSYHLYVMPSLYQKNLLSDVLSRFRKKDDFKDDDGGPQDEDSEDMVYVIKEDAPKVEKILEAEPGPSNVKRWPEIDIRASVLTDEEGEGMNMLDTATTSIKIAGRQDEDPDLKVVKRVIKDKLLLLSNISILQMSTILK